MSRSLRGCCGSAEQGLHGEPVPIAMVKITTHHRADRALYRAKNEGKTRRARAEAGDAAAIPVL